MKANEVRIGNYYLYHIFDVFDERKEWDEINQIDIEDLIWLSTPEGEVDTDYRPMPISEEWLLMLGFKEGYAVYSEGFSIDVQETDFYLRPCFHGGYYWGFNLKDKMDCEFYDVLPLKYVHELQNLYYALTGKELSLQPKINRTMKGKGKGKGKGNCK